MDKFRLLQEFAELAAEKALAIDQVRLYLLLLAACGEEGEGSIHPAAIDRALGKAYTPADMRRDVRRLAQENLIEIVSLPGAAGSTLRYRLLPIGSEER